MLKEERYSVILDLINKKGILKVSDITDVIDVTEVTVRRDLQDLDQRGLLKRIHGGAQSTHPIKLEKELSHIEKKNLNLDSKIHIAKKIATTICDGDSLFLGPGTTIELVHDYLNVNNVKIVTNSIHVFNGFIDDSRYELILIGGSYRNKTGAFVGSIANDILSRINIDKAFIGVNAINDNTITNSNEDEGMIQTTILNNALEKYIVADSSKLNKRDFYQFYTLDKVTAIITDNNISSENIEKYSKYTKLYF